MAAEDTELEEAIAEHNKVIADETLATVLSDEGSKKFTVTAKIDGADLVISLQKT